MKLVDAPARRWVPLLLLAAYAACDFLAQALLPAVAAAARAGWPSLPDGVLEFLRVVVGKHAHCQADVLCTCAALLCCYGWKQGLESAVLPALSRPADTCRMFGCFLQVWTSRQPASSWLCACCARCCFWQR